MASGEFDKEWGFLWMKISKEVNVR